MVSYTQFRDVTAVFSAGTGLTNAGKDYGSKLTSQINSLRTGEGVVLHKADEYGKGFWSQTYAAAVPTEKGSKPRHLALTEGAVEVVKAIEKIGPDVVMACQQIVGTDAAQGAALLRASTLST